MVMILGHRGARGLWPENTIAGFRNAIALGVDIIEFDLHLSSDGVPVVMHDYTLDRTTNATGTVGSRTADELAAVTIRDSEETVPTFEQLLAAVAGSGVQLAVEIKTSGDASPYPGLERKALDLLHKYGAIERSMIISFVPTCHERVRALHPDIKLMACVWRPQTEFQGGLGPALDRFLSIPGTIAAVQEELLSHNERFCFERVPPGQLAVGVNNDPDRMAHWLARPVRQISTDRPDIALKLRNNIATASV
jgi:glycerophosphoryl diester phosphodiesterase